MGALMETRALRSSGCLGGAAAGMRSNRAWLAIPTLLATCAALAVANPAQALAEPSRQTLSGTAKYEPSKHEIVEATVNATLNGGSASGTLSTVAPGTVGGQLSALAPASVAAEAGTARLIVSADGKNVYATNRNTNVVSVYARSASGALTAKDSVRLKGVAEPEGIVESPDSRNVYVANYGTNSVTALTRNANGELGELQQAPSGEAKKARSVSASVLTADSSTLRIRAKLRPARSPFLNATPTAPSLT